MNSLSGPAARGRTLLIALCVIQAGFLGAAALLVRAVSADALPVFTEIPLPEHKRIHPPETSVSGISYDGSSLWITIDGGQVIYQVDEKTNAILRRIPFPEKYSGGSAWDGRYLWQMAWMSKKIYKLDLATGALLESFPTPGKGMCAGLTYDGRYLWAANFEDGKIFQIDQNRQGRVLRTIDGLLEVTGLAWDGKYLWNGILVGTKTHDEATPYTGFFQQRDLQTMRTLRVFPLPGIGPGTSDWLPGGGLARRFWWYDGFYNRLVRVDLPGRDVFRWGYALAAAGLAVCGVIAFALLRRIISSPASR